MKYKKCLYFTIKKYLGWCHRIICGIRPPKLSHNTYEENGFFNLATTIVCKSSVELSNQWLFRNV